jgi:uncharacterized membrane protein YgdD (TMEM256/DUF423 family)
MARASMTLSAFASLLGAAGVILAAASAHTGGNDLARTASLFLIMHAAALLGISATARAPAPARALVIAGAALGIGSLLFSLDLASRAFLGERLFAFAAPLGGSLMILSWFALAGIFILAALRAPRD